MQSLSHCIPFHVYINWLLLNIQCLLLFAQILKATQYSAWRSQSQLRLC